MTFQAGGVVHPDRSLPMFADKTFEVKPFLIDQKEVTLGEFLKVFPGYLGFQDLPMDNALVRSSSNMLWHLQKKLESSFRPSGSGYGQPPIVD